MLNARVMASILIMATIALPYCIAQAETAENWVICNSCETDQDFANAAMVWIGQKTGQYTVEIANASTLRVNRVVISSRGEYSTAKSNTIAVDEPPRSAPVLIRKTNDPIAFVSPDDLKTISSQRSTKIIAVNEREDANVEKEFEAILNMHKNDILISAPSN